MAVCKLIEPWLSAWRLVPDGDEIVTHASRLLPVLQGDRRAMLKVATADEERRGAALMVWWAGEGAAPVLAHEGEALLLERAMGARSLEAMALSGSDDEATRILCAAAASLHARPPESGLELIPLPRRFTALAEAAQRHGRILAEAKAVVDALLADPREVCVLHGDLHHGNVLDFGSRGWLTIDPKGVLGERTSDFCNMLCNPYGPLPSEPGRFARQARIIAEAAHLDLPRLMRWTFASATLFAVWATEAGADAEPWLAVARLAAKEV